MKVPNSFARLWPDTIVFNATIRNGKPHYAREVERFVNHILKKFGRKFSHLVANENGVEVSVDPPFSVEDIEKVMEYIKELIERVK